MTVALVTHNVLRGDGQGRVNYELTRYLLERGVDVTLVADQVASELQERGATWIPVELSRFERTAALFKVWGFARRADRILREIRGDVDVIIGCGVTLGVPHDINVVHFSYGGWRRSPYHAIRTNPSLNSAYQWVFTIANDRWERETLRNARRVVAVSQMVKDELLASGFSGDSIDVVINGVDTDEFCPGPADRDALGLPDEVPLGLFVGDLHLPIKNPDGMLRALSDVPEAHLAVAGSLEGSFLPGLAKQLGVGDRVHFLGFRRDIPALMRAVDFFALPSRRDSCPLALLEALASGLPAVVTQNVGTSHLVDRNAGFVVDSPNDHQGLAAAIRRLVTSPDLRQRLGANAREVAEEHSWEDAMSRYHHLIREMAQ